MIEQLLNISDLVLRDKVTKLAAVALFLSATITLILWVLFAGTINFGSKEFKASLETLTPYTAIAISASFVIFFFVLWYILYIQYIKEAEDVYSRLREKLEGSWLSEYDYFVGGAYLFDQRPIALFKFVMNIEEKLEMEFDPKQNMLFSDANENLNVISIRHVQGNRYSLTLYYKQERRLRGEILKYIERETETADPAKLNVEVFSILSFEEPRGSARITQMRGEWFDLNGNLRALGLLMKKVKITDPNFRGKLSEFLLNNTGSARMGEVEFRRH